MKFTYFKLAEGVMPPWYMGYAWYDVPGNYTVMLPLPFNRIAAALRWAYLKLRHPSYTALDIYISKRVREISWKIHNEGKAEGIAIGRSQIYDELNAEIEKQDEYSGNEDKK